jgi:hypothetical protein
VMVEKDQELLPELSSRRLTATINKSDSVCPGPEFIPGVNASVLA